MRTVARLSHAQPGPASRDWLPGMTSEGVRQAVFSLRWTHVRTIQPYRLLRYAGLFTWAMVGVPLVYSQYVPAATSVTR